MTAEMMSLVFKFFNSKSTIWNVSNLSDCLPTESYTSTASCFFPSASLIWMIHWHYRTLEGQIQKLNNELADTAQACLAMRKQLPSSTHQTELSISPPPATIPQPKPNSSQQVDTCGFHYIHLRLCWRNVSLHSQFIRDPKFQVNEQ